MKTSEARNWVGRAVRAGIICPNEAAGRQRRITRAAHDSRCVRLQVADLIVRFAPNDEILRLATDIVSGKSHDDLIEFAVGRLVKDFQADPEVFDQYKQEYWSD